VIRGLYKTLMYDDYLYESRYYIHAYMKTVQLYNSFRVYRAINKFTLLRQIKQELYY